MPKPAGFFILFVALLLPVAARAGTTHESFDVTGAVFPCPNHTYTVTSGVIKEVFHESVDANGITHFTVTDTPSNVRLVTTRTSSARRSTPTATYMVSTRPSP
jgi:hypothetical protein